MTVNETVGKERVWVLEKLYGECLIYEFPVFVYTPEEDERTVDAKQQRKILVSLIRDGAVNCTLLSSRAEPPTTPAKMSARQEASIINGTKPLKLRLLGAAFSQQYGYNRQRHGTMSVKLVKDFTAVYIYFGKTRVLLHTCKANSSPDYLLDYLIEKKSGSMVTKAELVEEGVLAKNSKSLGRYFFDIGFRGPLQKHFLPVLDASNVKLLTDVRLPYKHAVTLQEQLSAR